MQELKIYISLFGGQRDRIAADTDDLIGSWVQDILHSHTPDTSLQDCVLLRNETVRVYPEQSFWEAGFKDGDVLYLHSMGGEPVAPEPDAMNEEAEGQATSSPPAGNKEPPPAETPATRNHKVPSQLRRYIALAAAAIAIAAVIIYALRPAVQTDAAPVTDKITALQPAAAAPPAPPNHEDRYEEDSAPAPGTGAPAREHERPVLSTGGQEEPTNHTEPLITTDASPEVSPAGERLTPQQCFDRLASAGMPEKRKGLLVQQLLRLFTSPDAPVVKMNNGRATNTGTTIADYAQSVVLLGTMVHVTDQQMNGDKISKLFVTEEK